MYRGKRKERKDRIRFPLNRREATVLKAIDTLERRGFSRIRVGDIASISTRIYPEEYRSALSEYDIVMIVEKLIKRNYVEGYGQVAMQHMRFLLTDRGKDILKQLDNEPTNLLSGERGGRGGVRESVTKRRLRATQKSTKELGTLTPESFVVLETIAELKYQRGMSKVLFQDILRRGDRKRGFPSKSDLFHILTTLLAKGYLQWLGHYDLTEQGKKIFFET